MAFNKITESESNHHDLEHKSTLELLQSMNKEDHSVPNAIELVIPKINALVE